MVSVSSTPRLRPHAAAGHSTLLLVLLIAFSSLFLGVFSHPTESTSSTMAERTDDRTASKASRFPADSQTPEQKAALAEAERLTKKIYGESFKLKDPQGNLLGPFGILAYTPKTFLAYLNYTQAYTTLPNLTPRERELSTLATVSVTKSDYVEYAHQQIGISVGLTKAQVERASKGRVPKGLSDREECIYELALDLAQDFGVMKDRDFSRAVSLLGREGIAALTQLVGGYMLSSTLVSVAGVPVPDS